MPSTPPTASDRDSPAIIAYHHAFFSSCLEFIPDERTPGEELWTVYTAYNADGDRPYLPTRRAREERAPMWRSLELAGAKRFILSDRVQFGGVRVKPAAYRRAFMREIVQERRDIAEMGREAAREAAIVRRRRQAAFRRAKRLARFA